MNNKRDYSEKRYPISLRISYREWDEGRSVVGYFENKEQIVFIWFSEDYFGDEEDCYVRTCEYKEDLMPALKKQVIDHMLFYDQNYFDTDISFKMLLPQPLYKSARK